MRCEPKITRAQPWGLAFLLAASLLLAGCYWAMPRVDNPFSNLRVDLVKNDAPNYTVLVRNNSPDHLQVVILATESKNWSAEKTHEERFVLEPKGQASFPVPLRTKRVRVVESRLISH